MQITLIVGTGPHKGRNFRFGEHDTFLVGRSRRAHFRLPADDRRVSRVHFMLEVNPPRCRLMDMGSRNGTYVNGFRVQEAELHDRDEIRAGRTLLRVAIALDATGPAPLHPTATAPKPPAAQGAREPATAPPSIPDYEILRELGRGGMGVVWLARRCTDDTRVALKTVTPAGRAPRGEVERFLREARILQELDHPNIIAFHEMGEVDGRLYFAMEYVQGTDAAGLLKEQGPLEVTRAVRLICQLLQALEYAHAKGFVHRDIKPANLLVVRDGPREIIKLADFGLARVYQASKLSGLTVFGEAGGTVAFMAPEQVTSFRDARPPADQYAAAATLYKLLTGRHVHDLPREAQKPLLMILEGKPVLIRTRRPDVPEGLAAAIHRALVRDPKARFPGAKEMHRALVPFCR
jgi:serine/threonine-protein kinase